MHDRLGTKGPGPEDYAAAWAMGNSVDEWIRSYFPTYRLEQMRKAQLGMDDYRQNALQQQGQPEADPVAQLVRGEAPAIPRARPPAAAPPPPPTQGMQHQMQQLQHQQHQLLSEIQQQRDLILQLQPPQPAAGAAAAGPAAAAAPPAAAAAVKPEPQWPELDEDEEWDMFIDLCSNSESDWSDSEA